MSNRETVNMRTVVHFIIITGLSGLTCGIDYIYDLFFRNPNTNLITIAVTLIFILLFRRYIKWSRSRY